MRCFISINLEESLKMEIDKAIEILRSGNPDVRWVPVGNMHMTLKFLGNTEEETASSLDEKLSRLAARHESFRLNLRGIGLFPDKRRPRVVWIDIPDSEDLKELQRDVEEAALSAGFEREDRPFSPHLTIGRVRSSRGMNSLLAAIETLKDKDFGNIEVNAVSLMKSDLRPAGAQYTTLAEFRLGRRIYDE